MPTTAFERWSLRAAFAVRQSTRVAWYAGHRALTQRMDRHFDARGELPRRFVAKPSRPVPGTRRLLADVTALFARDLANVEAGYYPPPLEEAGGLPKLLSDSRAFLRDAPEVIRRQRQNQIHEVPRAEDSRRPEYYSQNFHFQSGGWMTAESARLYDMQVEVLFFGAASAMRRQALVPIAEALAGRDQRDLLYADIASGTGLFVEQVRQAFPRLPAVLIDLSEPYLGEAMRRLGRRPKLRPLVAKAEALPLADASLDIATAIFLLHELPPEVRRAVAQEIGRVLRPGGLFILVDSLQSGEVPEYDGLLEVFPALFHEPYFSSYLREDLADLFVDAGLVVKETTKAFLAKIVTLRKP